VSGALPTIDDVAGRFDAGGLDYTSIPHIATSRFARAGDLLELAVTNETRSHHPFHLHGFSFQPVQVLDPAREPILRFDYSEMIDTFDIPSEHSLVFCVRLNFRFYNWEKARPAGHQDLRPRDPREICFNGTCRRVIAMA
jgi:hypothetical protein